MYARVVGDSDLNHPPLTAVCQDLPPLENGVIVYSSDESPRPVGTVATHRCNSGFMLVGVVNRTCEESGRFSGTAPTCEGE